MYLAYPVKTSIKDHTVGLTTDRNNPGLLDIDDDTGMQLAYLVLSNEERDKGFVRPVRTSYQHIVCGNITTMSQAIAETYAREPKFYSGTMCRGCHEHFPVGQYGQFVWVEGDTLTDIKVGT